MRFSGTKDDGTQYVYDTEWDIEDNMFKAKIAADNSTVYLLNKYSKSTMEYFYIRESLMLFFEDFDTVYKINLLLNKRRLKKEFNPKHSQMTITDLKNMFRSQISHRYSSTPLSMYIAVEYLDEYPNLNMYDVPKISFPVYVFLKDMVKDFLQHYKEFDTEKQFLFERQISFYAQSGDCYTDYPNTYFIDGYIVSPITKNSCDTSTMESLLHDIQTSGLQKSLID